MTRRSPALPAAAALLATGLAAGPAAASCPSYTASSNYNQYDCAIEAVPGDNPSIDAWNGIFALVSQGPSAWTNEVSGRGTICAMGRLSRSTGTA